MALRSDVEPSVAGFLDIIERVIKTAGGMYGSSEDWYLLKLARRQCKPRDDRWSTGSARLHLAGHLDAHTGERDEYAAAVRKIKG